MTACRRLAWTARATAGSTIAVTVGGTFGGYTVELARPTGCG